MTRGSVTALVVAFLAAACSSSSSSSSKSMGEGCTADAECSSGLTCLPALVAGQCSSQKTCTKSCAADADCQAVSAKSKCFAGCDNTKVCLLTP